MEVSATSLISLRSISDTELETERKPVRRSSTGGKRAQKPVSPSSPYGTIKRKPTKRTGREIWVESIQQGGGVSAESKGTNTWRYGKPSHLANVTSATPFLKDQLKSGSGSPLPNKHSRPSSAAARVGGTGPVYKDAETYYDDIQVLKRQLKQLKDENELVKAKNGRLEDEVIAKSRKIEELLNPELQSNDMRRTLTSRRPDTSEVVMSLRRKIYKVEENLRDKENIIRKMKSEMKQTNVEELVLENQVCIYEIERLTRMANDSISFTRSSMNDGMVNDVGGTKGKSQILLKRLQDDNHTLVLENKSLKNDLMKLGRGSQTDLNASKDYEDMNRNELLRKISSLEQRLKIEEKKIFREESTTEMSLHSENIDDRCIDLKGPLPQQVKQLRARERELIAEVENLEGTVKKLKEDRTHYRKKNDEYRQQLDNVKIESFKKKPEDGGGSDTASIKSEKSPKHRRSPVKRSSDKTSKVRETKVSETKITELREKNAAKKIQRSWRSSEDSRKSKMTFQKQGDLKKITEEEELEDAIIRIQSSWRGHKTRQSYVNSTREREYSSYSKPSGELEDDELILIQSALRGHHSRKQLLQNSRKQRSSLSNKSLVKSVQEVAQSVEETEDDDDDVVIGSSASLSRFRTPDHIPSSQEMSKLGGGKKTQREKNRFYFSDSRQSSEETDHAGSLRNLKSTSSPWAAAIHEDGSEESDNLLASSKRKVVGKNLGTDERPGRNITKKWADTDSGDSGDKKEQRSFQKRLSLRKTQQLLDDFKVTDDDDSIVAPTFQKKLKVLAATMDDELF